MDAATHAGKGDGLFFPFKCYGSKAASNPYLTVSIGSDSTYETNDDNDSLSDASSLQEVGGEGAEEESSTKPVGGGTLAVSSSRSAARARSQQDIPISWFNLKRVIVVVVLLLLTMSKTHRIAGSPRNSARVQSAVDSLSRLDWTDADNEGDNPSVQRQEVGGIKEGHEQCLWSSEDLMDSLYQELAQFRRESPLRVVPLT